jgi:hypothetical protein
MQLSLPELLNKPRILSSLPKLPVRKVRTLLSLFIVLAYACSYFNLDSEVYRRDGRNRHGTSKVNMWESANCVSPRR